MSSAWFGVPAQGWMLPLALGALTRWGRCIFAMRAGLFAMLYALFISLLTWSLLQSLLFVVAK